MSRARRVAGRRTQGGALVLAALMLGLVLAAGYTLDKLAQRPRFRDGVDHVATSRALATAKAALLDYAVFRADAVGDGVYSELGAPDAFGVNPAIETSMRPGALPCPDIDGDQLYVAQAVSPLPLNSDNIGAVCRNFTGWLPGRSLGVGDLVDGSGARLWFALSPVYQPNSTAAAAPAALNPSVAPDWDGNDYRIEVAAGGTTIEDVVAVIIAPGPPLAGEDRTRAPAVAPNAINEIADWLDAPNATVGIAAANALRTFAGTTPQGATTTANDRIVTITRSELMNRVQALAIAEFGRALRNRFYNPNPSAVPPVTGNCQSYLSPGGALNSISEWCLPWPTRTFPAPLYPDSMPDPGGLDTTDQLANATIGQMAGWLGDGDRVRDDDDSGDRVLEVTSNRYVSATNVSIDYDVTGATVHASGDTPALEAAFDFDDLLVTRDLGTLPTEPPTTNGSLWCALAGPEHMKCLFEKVEAKADTNPGGRCPGVELVQSRMQVYMPFFQPVSGGTWWVRTASLANVRRRHYRITASEGATGWPLSDAAENVTVDLFALAGAHPDAKDQLNPPAGGAIGGTGGGARIVWQCVAPGNEALPETTGGRAWKYLRFAEQDTGGDYPGGILRLWRVPYPFQLAELEPVGNEANGLPHWFADNGWQQHVGVVLSDAILPGRKANIRCELNIATNLDDCTSSGGDTNRFVLDGPHPARPPGALFNHTQVSLAVVGAGVALGTQDRTTPPIAMEDYFEQPDAFIPGATGPGSYPSELELVAFAVPGASDPAGVVKNDQVLILDKDDFVAGVLSPTSGSAPPRLPAPLVVPLP